MIPIMPSCCSDSIFRHTVCSIVHAIVFSVICSLNVHAEGVPPGKDWLLHEIGDRTQVQRAGNRLILSNGIVSRTFTTGPNVATVGLDHLITGQAYLRSVRPEAEITIDGLVIPVGGLDGQKVHNYLLPEWIDHLVANPASFRVKNIRVDELKERFPWKKRRDWMDRDYRWPLPGKEVVFTYNLPDEAIRILSGDGGKAERELLFHDSFEKLSGKWKVFRSKSHARNSFENEGKPGEIMALPEACVAANCQLPYETEEVNVLLSPGTDTSGKYGPGVSIGFRDGRLIKASLDMETGKILCSDGKIVKKSGDFPKEKDIWLRFVKDSGKEGENSFWVLSLSIDGKQWTPQYSFPLAGSSPVSVTVGKMDSCGGLNDGDVHFSGDGSNNLVRCKIREVEVRGVSGQVPSSSRDYLKNVEVDIHYEMYDGLPVVCKWMAVRNGSDRKIVINRFKSEILAVHEVESVVDDCGSWLKPNILVQTDYHFGGQVALCDLEKSSMQWIPDPLYETQVNYNRKTPCLLEISPKIGPACQVESGREWESYRSWELFHDSTERERKGMETRRMYRVLCPWTNENPILMHVRDASDEAVKKAIDQCADVGFEMVIMTFGSGFNIEDDSDGYLKRMKSLSDYAHGRGIALGGYSLLASRSINEENNVVSPLGKSPRFGSSPCLGSLWGRDYLKKLYGFFEKTNMDILEHDGSYPGDVCTSGKHPGHVGLEDSQWNQFQAIRDFYRWCRGRGIYLNVPDVYYFNGSNKNGMGYRETNWSLPRAWQEIIERQNIYDGTYEKTPSMGWMFVPLVAYHGGGPDAVITPLSKNLAHYEQRLANLFGAGVQACYRGPELYDSSETRAVVKKWVEFYKKHREVLGGDIVHLRRPDGRDYDAILHVNPQGKEQGLLMVYNPLEQEIRKKIVVPMYYTGLRKACQVSCNGGDFRTIGMAQGSWISLDVTVPARSQSYYVFKRIPGSGQKQGNAHFEQ